MVATAASAYGEAAQFHVFQVAELEAVPAVHMFTSQTREVPGGGVGSGEAPA